MQVNPILSSLTLLTKLDKEQVVLRTKGGNTNFMNPDSSHKHFLYINTYKHRLIIILEKGHALQLYHNELAVNCTEVVYNIYFIFS